MHGTSASEANPDNLHDQVPGGLPDQVSHRLVKSHTASSHDFGMNRRPHNTSRVSAKMKLAQTRKVHSLISAKVHIERFSEHEEGQQTTRRKQQHEGQREERSSATSDSAKRGRGRAGGRSRPFGEGTPRLRRVRAAALTTLASRGACGGA
eukprot:6193380-Pleurochrysis_carterae.AAC.3